MSRREKIGCIAALLFAVVLFSFHFYSCFSARIILADFFLKINNTDKAIEFHNKILRKAEVSKNKSGLNRKEIIHIGASLIELYLVNSKYNEAAQLLSRLNLSLTDLRSQTEMPFRGYDDYLKFAITLLRSGLEDNAVLYFQKGIEHAPERPLAYYMLALFYLDKGAEDEALIRFKDIIEIERNANIQVDIKALPYIADAYFKLGLNQEKRGNISKAKQYFNKSIQLESHYKVEEYYSLYHLLTSDEEVVQRQAINNELVNLNPQYEINYKFPNGLILQGYSLNNKEFELFNRGKIVFFWKAPNSNFNLSLIRQGGVKNYRISDRLFQIMRINNLAPNFGFEVDSLGTGYPAGWKSDFYKAPLDNHRIVTESKPLGKTQSVLLDNSRFNHSNYQTDYIPIEEDVYYLLSGWIKSQKGNAFLGLSWLDSNKIGVKYKYALSDLESSEWKCFSGILIPPKSSKYCRLHLTNFASSGKCLFDNVLFIKIVLPNQADIHI